MKKLMSPAIVIFVLVLILPSISAAFSGQQEPNKPTLTGPTDVKRGIWYTYHAVTTDPQGDAIFYRFQFYYNSNDNYITDWKGPYSSGSEASFEYKWHDLGVFQVGAQAKDTSGHESEWAALDVTVHRLFDSDVSSIPDQSSATIVSSITVTISLSGTIVQQVTYPLYFNPVNQQQNPQ